MGTTKRSKLPLIGKCSDHLGGRIAPLGFNRLIKIEWILPQDGKKTVFDFTEKGATKI